MYKIGDKVIYKPLNIPGTITDRVINRDAWVLNGMIECPTIDLKLCPIPDKKSLIDFAVDFSNYSIPNHQSVKSSAKCDCPLYGPEGVMAIGCQKGHK
jgi:hypothetical protein